MAQPIQEINFSSAYTVDFDLILSPIKAMSKKQILQELSAETARVIGANETVLLNHLMKQEMKNTSGIGHGVSIPHMRLARLTRPFIVFVKLENAIDFDSVDSELVDLVCLVLSPEHEGSKHLRRLSEITRLFQNLDFCKTLRSAQDRDDVKLALKQSNIDTAVNRTAAQQI